MKRWLAKNPDILEPGSGTAGAGEVDDTSSTELESQTVRTSNDKSNGKAGVTGPV